MKIILKGADFSANNIGQVEVPIFYTTEAKAYLNAIPTTKELLTFQENQAINNFFVNLTENNLLSKIERVYIPRFGATDGAINMVNPTQTPLNLPSSGVTYNVNGVALGQNFITANFVKGVKNSLIGFANKVAIDDNATSYSSALTYGSYASLGRKLSGESGLVLTSSDRNLIPNRTVSIGHILSSTNVAGNTRNVVVDGEYAETPIIYDHTIDTLKIGGDTNYEDCGHPISLLIFGQHLNQAESLLLGGFIDDLMNIL